MKKWIQMIQKYFIPTALIVFGVLFVYGLIFATPVSSMIRIFVKNNGELNTGKDYANAKVLFPTIDYVVINTEILSNQFLIFGIIGLVFCGIISLYRCNIRKRYYVTNFTFLGAFVGYLLFTFIYLGINLVNYSINLAAINVQEFTNCEPLVDFFTRKGFRPIDGFGFYHILGFVILLVMLFIAINVIILLIDKIKYEKVFKATIEGGNEDEK